MLGLVGSKTNPQPKKPRLLIPRRSGFKTSGLGLKQRTLVSNASGGPFQGWKLREKGYLGDGGNGRLTGAAVCVCEGVFVSCCVPGGPVMH